MFVYNNIYLYFIKRLDDNLNYINLQSMYNVLIEYI